MSQVTRKSEAIVARSLGHGGLVMALGLFACIGLLCGLPASALAGCPLPTFGNGSIDDELEYAQCLQSSGVGRVARIEDDVTGETCRSDEAWIPCPTPMATADCPEGDDYWLNGFDADLVVVAWDRDANVLRLGFRTAGGQVGDADGDGTDSEVGSASCVATPSGKDENGIGSLEIYRVAFDFNCDGSTSGELRIAVTDNAVEVDNYAGTATADYFYTGDGDPSSFGTDLEVIVTGQAGFPLITFSQWQFDHFVNAGDGLAEDVGESPLCPPPNPGLAIECAPMTTTTFCAGGTERFTVTVRNEGDIDLTDVTSSVTLPAGLTVVSPIIAPNDCNCVIGAPNSISCTIGTLPAGAACELVFDAQASKDCFVDGNINANANGFFALCKGGGLVTLGIDASPSSCPVTCIPASCVQLDCGEPTPDRICANTPYSITLDVRNCGPLEEEICITGPGIIGSRCLTVPGNTTQQTTISLPAAPCPPGGVITHNYVAAIDGACNDPSDPATCEIICTPPPAVNLTCEPTPGKVCPGDEVTIELVATNTSGGTETIAIYSMPDNTLLRECKDVTNGGTCTYDDVVTAPDDCAPDGFSRRYEARARNANCPDPVTDPCEATIGCNAPDITVELAAGTCPEEVAQGETFTYTIEVCNVGPALDSVIVRDTLCADVTYANNASPEPRSVDATTGVIEWALGPLVGCETITFDVTASDENCGVDCINVVSATGFCGTATDTERDECVTTIPCEGEACPRTPGFWKQQYCYCEAGEGGRVKFDCDDLEDILTCIDALSTHGFGGGGMTIDNFCSALDNEIGDSPQERQANRQYAAFLSNVCVGVLGIPAGNGDIVSLPPETPISGACFGLVDATTVGDLIPEIDALLASADPPYGDIITCLDRINNGVGIPFDPEACVAEGNSVEQAFADAGLLPEYQTDVSPGVETELFKPMPNPFTGETRMAYAVTGVTSERVEIAIYNTAGQKVRTLVSSVQSPGRYETMWNGQNAAGEQVPAGVYFYRSVIGDSSKVSRVLLVR